MGESPAGYREIEHTADWALHVWGADLADLAGLLAAGAEGMFALMGVETVAGAVVMVPVELAGVDAETLLVNFLSVLLRIAEKEGLAPVGFDLDLNGYRLSGAALARPIARQDKEIKAVTFHNLQIVEKGGRLETTIVFDV